MGFVVHIGIRGYPVNPDKTIHSIFTVITIKLQNSKTTFKINCIDVVTKPI